MPVSYTHLDVYKRQTLVTEISNHLFNLQGKKMVMSITRDISKRKQNEDELLRILAGIEGTGDAIGIAMPDGSHFYQNKSFTELFGYTVDELNKPLKIVNLFADKERGNNILKKIMSGNDWNGELDICLLYTSKKYFYEPILDMNNCANFK